MAHSLADYSGPCRHIHGQSYELFETFTGESIPDSNSIPPEVSLYSLKLRETVISYAEWYAAENG